MCKRSNASGLLHPEEFRNLASSERDFWWFRGMRKILSAVLEPALNGRNVRQVLDAGCGTGFNARWLQKERGWRVYACDLDLGAMPYARGQGLSRIVQSDVTVLPFPDGCFDAVFSLDVLPHLAPGAERAALAEMARVTAPGGLLVLRAAALNLLRSRHSIWTNERQRFTRKRLQEAVENAGCRILRCTYANTLLLPVALFKFRVWEPLLRRPPASGLTPLPVQMNNLLSFVLSIEAAWLRAGFNLPLGQSLVVIAERQRC